ncbi:DUF2017 domain-containing protein [Luteimicrobium xylanilyticum]|uniref:Uncharacterized protein n=1 Tax=Luteimicrobium xylanilyticum TaxID=1133546 RepID=A0A5P9Q8J1_9MICO|nr:DUF2017 family protein [Luteimicrobium xylanilyticum]QFU97747.1 hypothetical protein KDY119_01246 [Luteimicrobium xylanilyticum]
MKPFRATRRGYVAQLDTPERVVLAHVVGDVVELLQDAVPDADGAPWGAIEADAPPAPRDAALARLLPEASTDPDVSAEFRRLTQGELAGAKAKRLLAFAERLLDDEVARAAATGRHVRPERTDLLVPRDAARDTAAALTDVRLVLASRLDVTTDDDAESLYAEIEAGANGSAAPDADDDARGADAPRQFLGAVFVTAGWLQESLVDAMLTDLRRRPPAAPGRAG